jgi:hypothetical protein
MQCSQSTECNKLRLGEAFLQTSAQDEAQAYQQLRCFCFNDAVIDKRCQAKNEHASWRCKHNVIMLVLHLPQQQQSASTVHANDMLMHAAADAQRLACKRAYAALNTVYCY